MASSKIRNYIFQVNANWGLCPKFVDSALDSDFSNLSIKFLEIRGAGNDCADFSGGVYSIDRALLDDCQDKAISIGEKSILSAGQVSVTKSNIALSAKDSSIVKISILETKDVILCAEVKRKKQEFGGADLLIKNTNCSIRVAIDSNSRFNRKGLWVFVKKKSID